MAVRSVDSDWETVSTGGGRADDWETVSGPKVTVAFSPSTATDEELRQAAIGGARPAIDEFHKRHLAESNPTLGAAAEEYINKATSALARSPVDIAKSLPSLLKTAAGAVIGFSDPMHPLAQEARESLKGMIGKMGEDVGTISSIIPGIPGTGLLGPPKPTGMPLSQYGKAGTATGENVGMVAAPVMAGIAARPVMKGISKGAQKLLASPEDLYQSALKPSTTYGPEKTARILKTGMEEGIPVSRAGKLKTADLIKQVKSDIESKIKSYQEVNPEATIDPEMAAKRIEEPGGIRQQYAGIRKGENMASIEAVKVKFGEDYPTPISLVEAQKVKQASYKDLGERSYEKRTGPGPAAEKQILRGIKEELEQFIPELKTMNAREGALIQFNKALGRAVAREKNHQWFGIGTPIAGAAGTALGGALGGAPGAAIGGTATTLLKYFLDKPSVKSNLAILMNRVKQVREAAPNVTSPSSVPGVSSTQTSGISTLPAGAYSAFGQTPRRIAEILRKSPVDSTQVVKMIQRQTDSYLSDWEDAQIQKKRTVYTTEGEQGRITGRYAEQESGIHPSEIPGIAELKYNPEMIKDALEKGYGPVYKKLRQQAEKLATEDHIARLVLDEATKERIAESAGSDEVAFRKLLKDEVTAKLSGATSDLPE